MNQSTPAAPGRTPGSEIALSKLKNLCIRKQNQNEAKCLQFRSWFR